MGTQKKKFEGIQGEVQILGVGEGRARKKRTFTED